jgi:hypothetical protein
MTPSTAAIVAACHADLMSFWHDSIAQVLAISGAEPRVQEAFGDLLRREGVAGFDMEQFLGLVSRMRRSLGRSP